MVMKSSLSLSTKRLSASSVVGQSKRSTTGSNKERTAVKVKKDVKNKNKEKKKKRKRHQQKKGKDDAHIDVTTGSSTTNDGKDATVLDILPGTGSSSTKRKHERSTTTTTDNDDDDDKSVRKKSSKKKKRKTDTDTEQMMMLSSSSKGKNVSIEFHQEKEFTQKDNDNNNNKKKKKKKHKKDKKRKRRKIVSKEEETAIPSLQHTIKNVENEEGEEIITSPLEGMMINGRRNVVKNPTGTKCIDDTTTTRMSARSSKAAATTALVDEDDEEEDMASGATAIVPRPLTDNESDAVTTIEPQVIQNNIEFPFDTEEDDHCETPIEAYQDILPLLQSLACTDSTGKRGTFSSSSTKTTTTITTTTTNGTNNENNDNDILIYDPYYCNGTVKRHLSSLGFTNVYNEKEDCYKVWKKYQQNNDGPNDDDNNNKSNNDNHHHHHPCMDMDVLITNPPYSGTHIEQLLQYIASISSSAQQNKNRPWMLLLPQWVHKKDYYQRLVLDTIMQQNRTTSTTNGSRNRHQQHQQRYNKVGRRGYQRHQKSSSQPFYIIPTKRYVYIPPKHFRSSRKSDTHKKSSPFTSMWYVWGGTTERNERWIRLLLQQQQHNNNSGSGNECSTFQIARSKSAIRDLRRKHTHKEKEK